jgi:hypothetical protein
MRVPACGLAIRRRSSTPGWRTAHRPRRSSCLASFAARRRSRQTRHRRRADETPRTHGERCALESSHSGVRIADRPPIPRRPLSAWTPCGRPASLRETDRIRLQTGSLRYGWYAVPTDVFPWDIVDLRGSSLGRSAGEVPGLTDKSPSADQAVSPVPITTVACAEKPLPRTAQAAVPVSPARGSQHPRPAGCRRSS